MNTTPKIESTLTGKFSDIIDFLSAHGADEADQLARRAVGIIITTDRPQTGEEADTDPFVANMLASAALVSLSESIKHYPFVNTNAADFDQAALLGAGGITPDEVLLSARDLIERAEVLLGLAVPPSVRQSIADTFAPVPGLAAEVDELICRIFEETGLLPAAVLVVLVDDADTADGAPANDGEPVVAASSVAAE